MLKFHELLSMHGNTQGNTVKHMTLITFTRTLRNMNSHIGEGIQLFIHLLKSISKQK